MGGAARAVARRISHLRESERWPGAYLVTCHSGVTLAAVHTLEVAGALVADGLNERYSAFSANRFTEAAT